ncbi:hypothetical protein KGF56_002142 [Candida oxycetoniae]|uniref:TECPR1-like DysF domain-containing protein n=1 Tax=Candida oxycetoniae TaxID=497107 RepID=A0AAI9WY96_9ASCO|nr:uncharacterized protein KGF56_002142 [Candida oxycetoniae]KAI3405057.2 hypothetical protein KGF56_002142 [Candida oxycetoniae]
MSVEEERKRWSRPSSSYYRDITNSAIDTSNQTGQQRPGSKRAFAAEAAFTLLEKGIDCYKNGKATADKALSPPSRVGSVDLTEDEISHIASMADSAAADEEEEKEGGARAKNGSLSKFGTSSHFADRVIQKLLKSTLPPEIPEREIFERRLNDPERNKRPGLSVPTLASNVKHLAGKMSSFFALQYELINIVAWKQPNKTISVLVLYTAAILWPHLIITYPLLFVLFGILIPGYVHRHPPRRPKLIKVKKRGQSLFNFLNAASESSIVEDMVDTEYLEEDAEIASTSGYSVVSEATTSTKVAESGHTSKRELARRRKSNLDLLINLRDFQNLTSDLLKGIDKWKIFYYETAGFKDERLSTFIFYGVLIATFATLFFGQFIPWRLIFIQGGWVGLILCHPNIKKYLVDMSTTRKERAKLAKVKAEMEAEKEQGKQKEQKEQKEEGKQSDTNASLNKDAKETQMQVQLQNFVTKFDRNDIIVDDPPEVRIVEVYELQIKSILKQQWSFYRYSNTLYDKTNKHRLSGKRPLGVEYLSKVYPPHEWKFDTEFVNKWILDKNPKNFIKSRSLNPELFRVRSNEDEGWIYDNMKDVVHSEIVYEFRRRRLYRECFRYGKPHKGFKR